MAFSYNWDGLDITVPKDLRGKVPGTHYCSTCRTVFSASESTIEDSLDHMGFIAGAIPRLTPEQIRLGRDAHRVGHIAPNILAQSLSDGLFDNIPEGLTGPMIL